MSDWPGGWYKDEDPPASSRGGARTGATPPGDPTVALPVRGAAGPSGAAGNWPGQPPPTAPGRGGRPPGTGYARRPWWKRPRTIFKLIAAVIVLALIAGAGLYFYLDSKLTRANVLADYQNRPAATAGQNWLITGSDSRQGLTRQQEDQLAAGHDVGGQRSDTIMVLHLPANGGPPVLVSLPRDSWVPIPGNGTSKINAAFAIGGPKLLAQTVETVTGLHIDHYMGIGFGGFVNVVDAIGGVRMCLPAAMVDPKAGLDLKAGCQTLNGNQALGYVRTRNFAVSDLQRVQDQRLFMKALLSKLTSAGTLANPFASVPAAFGSAGALIVDSGTHLYMLAQVAFALRNPETTTVPIASLSYQTPDGQSAVLWDRTRALQLFNDLAADRALPKDLVTGSSTTGTA